MTTEATMRKTPLSDWHAAHGGRMVDFAGWWLPVQYSSIVQEHKIVREQVGLTDISHMGRLRFEGPGAKRFLDGLLTRRVDNMVPGQVRYSLVTNEQGGILDDVLLGYYRNTNGQPFYVLVVNASNREKIVGWIQSHLTEERANEPGNEIVFTDMTMLWAMFAIQGPQSRKLLQPLVSADLGLLKNYRGTQTQILHPEAKRQGGIVSRTGYTGEDGFELSVGADIAVAVWEAILTQGESLGVLPVGLGARDTLRLEAAMPLYGHELDEATDPFKAGLGFACYLDGCDFPGREVLQKINSEPLPTVRVCIELSGRRAARQGSSILHEGQEIGQTTSGTFSPTLEKSLAMAYIPRELAEVGTKLEVDIRGNRVEASVVPLPFYRRPKPEKGKRK